MAHQIPVRPLGDANGVCPLPCAAPDFRPPGVPFLRVWFGGVGLGDTFVELRFDKAREERYRVANETKGHRRSAAETLVTLTFFSPWREPQRWRMLTDLFQSDIYVTLLLYI